MVRHLGLNPVLGYLGAGVLLGPLGLGSLSATLPLLSWFTIAEGASLAAIAELGVVFLLFLIGLELSLERLRTMRRLVFGLGSAQVVLTSLVITCAVLLAGHSNEVATVLGMSLALSSTAIVIEVLAHEQRLTTSAGRATFSVLLAQDLAVIPILLFVGIAAAGSSGALSLLIAQALLKAVLAVAIIVLLGRILLRPLFRLVATTRSTELFIATTLFVIVATSVAAALAGLSMALGAFIAGLMLAETEYRKAIETEIAPFKGLLLGIFFFTVGMKIDPRELLHHPVLLLACVVGLVGIKAAIVLLLARLFRLSWGSAIEAGLLLGPGGEFAFVAIGSATALGLIAADVAGFTLAITAVSMALIPLLAVLARRIRANDRFKAAAAELLAKPQAIAGHAIIVGYGRVGTVVADMLQRHDRPYIALEDNPTTVAEYRRRGQMDVYFGNAADLAMLKTAGLMEAAAVIVTTHRQSEIDEIVTLVRRVRPDVPIISRARDAAHARHLYAVGVTDAVPETIEASLQLSEAALVGLGLAAGPVIASIHEKRDEFRHDLQQAAGDARERAVHAVKSKTEGRTTARR
jgi:monovalent cation:H+ antiporter-2, CPA2 family